MRPTLSLYLTVSLLLAALVFPQVSAETTESFSRSLSRQMLSHLRTILQSRDAETVEKALEFCAQSGDPVYLALLLEHLSIDSTRDKCTKILLDNPQAFAQIALEVAKKALQNADSELLFAYGSKETVPEMLKHFAGLNGSKRTRCIERLCRNGLPEELINLAKFHARDSGSDKAVALAALVDFFNGAPLTERFAQICVYPPTRLKHALEQLGLKLEEVMDDNIAESLRESLAAENAADPVWQLIALQTLVRKNLPTGSLEGFFANAREIPPWLDSSLAEIIKEQNVPTLTLDDFFTRAYKMAGLESSFPLACLCAAVQKAPFLARHFKTVNPRVATYPSAALLAETIFACCKKGRWPDLPVVFLDGKFWKTLLTLLENSTEELSDDFVNALLHAVLRSEFIDGESLERLIPVCQKVEPEWGERLRSIIDLNIGKTRAGEPTTTVWMLEKAFSNGTAPNDRTQRFIYRRWLTTGNPALLKYCPSVSPDVYGLPGASVSLEAMCDTSDAGSKLRVMMYRLLSGEIPFGPLVTAEYVKLQLTEGSVVNEQEGVSVIGSKDRIAIWQELATGKGRVVGELFASPSQIAGFSVSNSMIQLLFNGSKPIAISATCDVEKSGKQWKVTIDLNSKELLDSDRDGLSDDFELAMGCDPENKDTDKDGLLDGEDVFPRVQRGALSSLLISCYFRTQFQFPFIMTSPVRPKTFPSSCLPSGNNIPSPNFVTMQDCLLFPVNFRNGAASLSIFSDRYEVSRDR